MGAFVIELLDPVEFYQSIKLTGTFPDFASCFSLGNMIEAARICNRGVSWKHQVQEFQMDRVLNCCKLLDELEDGTYEMSFAPKFHVYERGKRREVKSINVRDRVVQRCLCDNFYVPLILDVITPNNSACLKGRGLSYALKHVGQHVKQAPMSAWVYKFDFKKYFFSIDHNTLKLMLNQLVDNVVLRHGCSLEKKYSPYKWLFNLIIDCDKPIKDNPNIGLELGSPVSQDSGLLYPNQIDYVLSYYGGVLGYHRYMDDGIVVCESRAIAREVDVIVHELAKMLKLTINDKKTYYNKITQPFIFLKRRYTKTGEDSYKVNLCKEQTRHAIKHLRHVFARHDIPNLDNVISSYRGYMQTGDIDMFWKVIDLLQDYPHVLRSLKRDTSLWQLIEATADYDLAALLTDPC